MFVGVLATALLFPCCTLFVLHSLNIEKYWKWTKDRKQKTQPKKRHYPQYRELVSLLFWYLLTHFCHYIVLNGWSCEKELIYSFGGKEYVCQGLKILKIGWETVDVNWNVSLLDIRFSQNLSNSLAAILIMILRMNGHRKNIPVLALLFSKLLNHNYRPKQISLSKNLLKKKVLS